MSLAGKLETELEIKSSATRFHDVFSCRPHHVSKMTPNHVQGCDLHEGEWGKPGTKICWKYMHNGVPEVAKQIVEEIDNEKKSTTFKMIEGHLLENYSKFYAIVQATQKGAKTVVHWTLTYEKKSADTPEPFGIVQLAINMTKDIDAHLTKEQA